METSSSKSLQEQSLRNAHLVHPSSVKRLNLRKSFRTPVQTLPLSNEKSASRSYVVPAKEEENETPRTLIAGMLESAETQPVITRTLRRRSNIVSQSPKAQREFKSPRLSDILVKNLRKLDPQTASSPGSKFTPRTNIKNLLAGTEQEQTPLERTSKSARVEHPPSDSISSRVKRRESGWGQRLSISPVQVPISLTEDDFKEGATLISAREKKTRRSFQFSKNVEAKLPKHLSKSPAEKDTLDFARGSVEASEDENEDDPGVEEMEGKSSHHSKRHSSKSETMSNIISSPAQEKNNEQNSSQPDSPQISGDEPEVAHQSKRHSSKSETMNNIISSPAQEKNNEQNSSQPDSPQISGDEPEVANQSKRHSSKSETMSNIISSPAQEKNNEQNSSQPDSPQISGDEPEVAHQSKRHSSKSETMSNIISSPAQKKNDEQNSSQPDSPQISGDEPEVAHQSKRHSSKSETMSNIISSPAVEQNDKQNSSQPDSPQISGDEPEVSRPEKDFNEQNVNLSAKEKKMQETLSKVRLHQGLDSDEEDDILLQQIVMNNISHINLEKGETLSEGHHQLSASAKLQASRSVSHTEQQVISVSQGNNKDDEQEGGQHSELPSQSRRSNHISKHVNSSNTHGDRGGSEDLLVAKEDFMSTPHKSLEENRAVKSTSQLNLFSRSHNRAATDEEPEAPLIPLSKPDGVSKNGSMSTTLQREITAGLHTQVSQARTPIRNTSLLRSADPSLPGPSASLHGHSEYDLMESSSDAEKGLGHSKILRTPKSKRKSSSRTLSSRSSITKNELAEKYKSPSRSPGSPYRILRQSNADFRVIGQRCSTPLLRNKSFFHSTRVQETTPQDSTHNHTHLMGDDIHSISPIRPDVRLQRRRNLEGEAVDDVELGKNKKQAEKSSASSLGTEVPKTGLPRRRLTESVTKAVVNQSDGRMMKTAAHPGSSKDADANTHHATVSKTNKKRTLESDSEDELPNGISPLNTPHFTTTRPPQMSSVQNAPKMKQSTLINPDGVLKTTKQTQPKRAKTEEAKTTRGRRSTKQKMDITLPKSSVKFFAERHSSMKLSKDAVDEIVRVSETYWSDTWKALEAYALHAGRKKIIEEDVILLMKTQRVITGIGDLHDKIREYLPMELRTELIPLRLVNL